MLNGRRVLIVEDFVLVAEMLSEQLEQFGCDVVGPVGQLQPALDLASAEQLDGALLDIDLDGESSFPVADVLRRRGVPMIFLSGHGEDALPPHLSNELQLTKPVRAATLQAALNTLSPGRHKQGNVPIT
ncbi:MAG TPA: response regulator [Acidisphaera sp.]|nr:response regulator [Acidisphaera sp.]